MLRYEILEHKVGMAFRKNREKKFKVTQIKRN